MLKSVEASAAPNPNTKKPVKVTIVAFFFINLLTIFILYQTRPVFSIDMGAADSDGLLKSFHAAEKNDRGSYRWTRRKGIVVLPAVGSPFRIQVTGTPFRPKELNLQPPQIELSWDTPATSRTFQTTPDEAQFAISKTYALEIGTNLAIATDTGNLIIYSDSFQPGGGDTRNLGLLVENVTIQAYPNQAGFVLPPLLPWLALAITLLVLEVYILVPLAGRVGLRRNQLSTVWLATFGLNFVFAIIFLLASNFVLPNIFTLTAIVFFVVISYRLFLQFKLPLLPFSVILLGELALIINYTPEDWPRYLKIITGFSLSLNSLLLPAYFIKAPEKTRPQTAILWLSKNWLYIVIILFTGLAAIFRFYHLAEPSLWVDEVGQYPYLISRPDLLLAWPYIDHTVTSMLILQLQFLLLPFNDEGFLRLPSAIYGILLVPVTYGLVRELFNRKIALIAAWLTIFWPVLIAYSQEWRIYAFFVLFAAASAFYLLKSLRTNKITSWFGFVVCTSIGLYSHFNFLFPLAAMLLYNGLYLVVQLVGTFRQSHNLGQTWHATQQLIYRTVGSWFLVGLVYVGIFPFLLRMLNTPATGVGKGVTFIEFNFQTFYDLLAKMGLSSDLGNWTMLVLAGLGFGLAIWRWRWTCVFCILWFSVPFVVLSQVKGGAEILTAPRYLLFFVPVYIGLIAAGIVAAAQLINWLVSKLFAQISSLRRVTQTSFLLIIAILAAWQAFLTLPDYYENPKVVNTDLREAYNFVKADLKAGDVVVDFLTRPIEITYPHWAKLYNSYYLRSQPASVVALELDNTLPPDKVSQAINQNGRLWTLVTFESDADKVLKLTNPQAKAKCFREICAIQQPNPPNSKMADKLETFFKTYRVLNPKIADVSLDALKQITK